MEKNLAEAFNRAYAEALPGHEDAVAARSEEKLGQMGVSTLAGLPSIADIERTFCGSWPKVKGFLNFAIGLASWAPGMGAVAASARAVVTAIDKELVPNICELPKQ